MRYDSSPTCTQCRRPAVDQVGLTIARFDRLTPDEFGFCSLACFVNFVRATYIENARPAVAPASFGPAPASRAEGASGAAGHPPVPAVPAGQPAAPFLKSNRPGTVNPEAAVGGPARPQKQV